MKKVEKDQARLLRDRGMSMNEIAHILGVTKSSVSLWVRDIELSPEQRGGLSARGRSVESIELRRQNRLCNELSRRRAHFDGAVGQVRKVSSRDLFYMGCALYWGEGSKTSRGTLGFTNSDPRAIQVMMRFFREVCGVKDGKFRAHAMLHPHLKPERAEIYWSDVSGIPRAQFYKTSMQHNKSSKNKKDSLPNGTFTINVHDTVLYLKVMGWLEGMYIGLVLDGEYLPCKYHEFL